MFANKIAIVTGGRSGIGLALGTALASHGARVYLTDLDGDGVEEVARSVVELSCGGLITGHGLDVTDAIAVREFVARVVLDQSRIDYMFNNAGVGLWGEAQNISISDWNRAFDVNVRGVMHGVAAVYPIMVHQKHGHIVNTASLAGLMPVGLLTPYCTTKYAVVGLSTSLRVEAAAFGVRVSVVCPGPVETGMLDVEAPRNLSTPGRFSARQYLSSARVLRGPYPPSRLADDVLKGVRRNTAIIVAPRTARGIWLISRLFGGLISWQGKRAVAKARAFAVGSEKGSAAH